LRVEIRLTGWRQAMQAVSGSGRCFTRHASGRRTVA